MPKKSTSEIDEKNGVIIGIKKEDAYWCEYHNVWVVWVDRDTMPTIDHWIPRAKRTKGEPTMRILVCSMCNSIKDDIVFKTIGKARNYIQKHKSFIPSPYKNHSCDCEFCKINKLWAR